MEKKVETWVRTLLDRGDTKTSIRKRFDALLKRLPKRKLLGSVSVSKSKKTFLEPGRHGGHAHTLELQFSDISKPRIEAKHVSQFLKNHKPAQWKALRCGDVIRFRDQYRDTDTFFFDGKTIVEMYSNVDYGVVPPNMAYPQFPFTYWNATQITYHPMRWVRKTSDLGRRIRNLRTKNEDGDYVLEWEGQTINAWDKRGGGWLDRDRNDPYATLLKDLYLVQVGNYT